MIDERRSPELEKAAEEQAYKIAERFSDLMIPKYIAGYKEHGGDLTTKGDVDWLLTQIEQEAIDLFVYATITRMRLNALSRDIEAALPLDERGIRFVLKGGKDD